MWLLSTISMFLLPLPLPLLLLLVIMILRLLILTSPQNCVFLDMHSAIIVDMCVCVFLPMLLSNHKSL